jgi:long-chain acyl-CoA synthetase
MFHALTQPVLRTGESARAEIEPQTHAKAWPSLRWCLSAGAPLASEIRRRFEAQHGVPLRQGFGLTEATFSSIAQPEDEAGADSVGQPVFGVEVRICDDAGRRVAAGERGEILVRGQNVMAGYFEDPEATSQAMQGGWLRTGDVGVLDSAGRLTVVDRIKDLIVRGGFNVYPAEVEAVLLAHPDVHQVVVVGLADERYGEEVVAAVVPREGTRLDPDSLTAHCRQQLSPTKLPRLWAELSTIPMGPSGKLLRRAIKAMLTNGELHLLHPAG